MAKKTHRDDDQPKKPASSTQPQQPAETVPPKPPVPNMSLDEPEEEAMFVDEVVEEEAIPVLEAADEEPMLLSDEDMIAEEAEVGEEAEPIEEIVEAELDEDEAVLADEELAPQPMDSPPRTPTPTPMSGLKFVLGSAPVTPMPQPPSHWPVEAAPA